MGSLAPSTHWLPQDDLLLKNAIEAGASLEVLAKGAVRFSRIFSLQELKDRWYSLLYDPVVATEASLRMIEAEISGSGLQSEKNESNGTPGKRKSESVRQCYYGIRKRIFNEPLDSLDLDFLIGPVFDNAGSEPFSTNCFIGGQEPNFGVHKGSLVQVGTTGATFPTNGFSSVAVNAGCCDIVDSSTFLGRSNFVQTGELGHSEGPQELNSLESVDLEDIVFPDPAGQLFDTTISDCLASFQDVAEENLRVFYGTDTCGNLGTLASDSNEFFDYEQLSKSLFDLDYEDEPLLHEAGGKEIMDDWSSLLCDSPGDGELQNLDLPRTFVAPEECTEIPNAGLSKESQTVEQCSFDKETQKLSNPMHLELRNEVVCCTVNTEDTEIPGNEDVFLPICLTSTSISWMNEVYYPGTFYVDEFSHDRYSTDKHKLEGERSGNMKVHAPKQVPGSEMNKTDISPGSLNEILNRVGQTGKLNDSQNAELGSKIDTDPNQSINGALFDLEGCSNESDGEVPYFSDVEEMILDMDLCSDDDVDVGRYPTVLKYQNDDVRRRIIRLEQSVKAATERFIAGHNAYAVLYGRHSKYFIKKPKVLIGRGTEDVKVDIDLGREAGASKVSRRQAMLELENGGTFHLYNHGKYPIFVNGKEIKTGQSCSLVSGCLIEVKELAFLFETNNKSCKAAAAELHRQNH